MEDWTQKLIEAVHRHTGRDDLGGYKRWNELNQWLTARSIKWIASIETAQHAVELMELIDCWHDEDVANQPCAAPAPPTNPFIVERVVRELTCGASDEITVTMENDDSVDIVIKRAFYTPTQLRNLAKQLTDLADAHEAVYPPNHCAAAC